MATMARGKAFGRILWRIGDFPELEHLTPGQRAGVLARVPWWTYPIIVTRAVIAGAFVGGIVAGSLASMAQPPEVVAVGSALALALSSIGLYALQLARLRVLVRKSIADALRGERPPFCFACGYDLRGSDAACCPECGQTIANSAAGAT
jgi:hypothetical protein